jgi:hypothetical protein
VELLTITVLGMIALVVDIGGIVDNYCFRGDCPHQYQQQGQSPLKQ